MHDSSEVGGSGRIWIVDDDRSVRFVLAAALGSVIYRGIIQLALQAGLNPNDMKLISAILVVLALTVPKLSPLKRRRQKRFRERAVAQAGVS